MKIVFDLESDGLLYEGSKIWCISTHELETRNNRHYAGEEIDEGIEYLLSADLLIGHNISGFDVPLIEKLKNHWGLFDRSKLRDTYVMSKLFFTMKQSHSLDSWAKKFDLVKPAHDDWTQYSPEMRVRCDEDVKINTALYDYMVRSQCKKWPQWLRSMLLENDMHYWQALQELYGVYFNKEDAIALVEHLDEEIAKIEEELDPILPIYVKQVGTTVTKPFKKDGDYAKRVQDWFATAED